MFTGYAREEDKHGQYYGGYIFITLYSYQLPVSNVNKYDVNT